MNGDKKSLHFVLPYSENSYAIAKDFASNFIEYAKIPENLAERFVNAVSECTKNISVSSKKELILDLSASEFSATAELSGNILLSDSIISGLADEVLAASVREGTKIKIAVFQPDNRIFNNVDSDSAVTFAPIKGNEISRVCAMYRKYYGDIVPWSLLTVPGKMQQLISHNKLLVLGAYNKEKKLVGSIVARIQKRPFYIEIYPSAPSNNTIWESKAVEFLLGKIKFLKPDWILRYINDYPPFLSTSVGTMIPIGLMLHHSFSRPMQIVGKVFRSSKINEFYVPPQYSDSFATTMEMLGIPTMNMNPNMKNPSDKKLKYILKYENRNNTAVVRIKSYGVKISHSVMIISNIFGGIARKKRGTLYLDLPLSEPITAPLGEKLISSGFAILGYIPGNFLRLQKIIGKQLSLDGIELPENLAMFAETLGL